MSNLPKLIALEKLAQNVLHGRINIDMQVRSGGIFSITAKGNKKTLYNQSAKDINTNTEALSYLLTRIKQQVTDKKTGVITFTVNTHEGKIKIIEVESTHIL